MEMDPLLYKIGRPLERVLGLWTGGEMLAEKTQAPEFELLDHHGKKTKLSGFRGKNVILWFYPKADTPGCTLEGCGFRDRISEFENHNTVVLGVSFDSVESNMAFAKKFGFPFALLCDTEKKVGIEYGAAKDATVKVPARIGYWINPEGVIQKAYPSVNAKAFPEQVLQELKAF